MVSGYLIDQHCSGSDDDGLGISSEGISPQPRPIVRAIEIRLADRSKHFDQRDAPFSAAYLRFV